MSDQQTPQPYLVIAKLLVPQAPGKKPSVQHFAPGQVIIFDGDEPVDVPALVRTKAIRPITEQEVAALLKPQVEEALGVKPKRSRK